MLSIIFILPSTAPYYTSLKCIALSCEACYVSGSSHLLPHRSRRLDTLFLQGSLHCTSVQCNTVRSTSVQCNTVQCTSVPCNTVQCTSVQCNTVQSTSVQCNTVQSTSVQCIAVNCTALCHWKQCSDNCLLTVTAKITKLWLSSRRLGLGTESLYN